MLLDSLKVRPHWFPGLNQWQMHSPSWITAIDVFLSYHFGFIVLITWANWDIQSSKLENKDSKSFTGSFKTSSKFKISESTQIIPEYLDYNWDKNENSPKGISSQL